MPHFQHLLWLLPYVWPYVRMRLMALVFALMLKVTILPLPMLTSSNPIAYLQGAVQGRVGVNRPIEPYRKAYLRAYLKPHPRAPPTASPPRLSLGSTM